MKKYVAYIDILGFKNLISSISQDEARQIIESFHTQIATLWKEKNYDGKDIYCLTFSDSIIIYSTDGRAESLKLILDFLTDLYRVSITNCNLLLRGGISFGEFDHIQTNRFGNLDNRITLGQAFIDAYMLESAYNIKGSKLIFKQEIRLRIERLRENYVIEEISPIQGGIAIYELKWADLLYLVSNNYEALQLFVDLAARYKWPDHFFATLETVLHDESRNDRRDIYIQIIDRLKTEFQYNNLDDFIKNFISTDSIRNTTKLNFLAYLRENL